MKPSSRWYRLSISKKEPGKVGVDIHFEPLHPEFWKEIYSVLRELGVGRLKSLWLTASVVVHQARKKK